MEINHRDIDCIDAILYINLDNRTDRKEHVLNEISKICTVQEKIYRIDAIKHNEGIIGCCLSHIKALTFALANEKWNNILILEDDFTFRSDNFNEIRDSINELLNFDKEIDVALLTYNNKAHFYYIYYSNSKVIKMEMSMTACGYIIKKHYILNLLHNFSESNHIMKMNGRTAENSFDVAWNPLQKSGKWYSTDPSIGYQYDNYSDIEKCEVKYDC
jgi:glycosyl transferase family 25